MSSSPDELSVSDASSSGGKLGGDSLDLFLRYGYSCGDSRVVMSRDYKASSASCPHSPRSFRPLSNSSNVTVPSPSRSRLLN